MIILGINAYHGDVAAVLLRDGQVIAAVEEERFRRIKHVAGFPAEAIRVALEMAGASPADVDHFAISRNPRANLSRKVAFALRSGPSLSLVRDRLRNRRAVADVPGVLAGTLRLDRERVAGRMHWVEHHPAHLASAFFASPFEEAAVCAIDGFGDFVSTSSAAGRGSRLGDPWKVYFPHSLGLVYLALTQYLGFLNYGDEFKVMGLAPYGEPRFADALRRLIDLEPGGGFALDLAYFRHWSDNVPMTWDDGEPKLGQVYSPRLEALLGPARRPGDPLEPRHEAIAASLQVVFEEAAFHVLNGVHRRTGMRRLAFAGGCAMNSVANGKIRANTPFEEVYIQPASGDNGTALGAALYVWHHLLRQPRRFVMDHAYWGPVRRRSRALRLDGRSDCRRAHRRMVPGTDGVGGARARQP
jgi:carbamoyltransferase